MKNNDELKRAFADRIKECKLNDKVIPVTLAEEIAGDFIRNCEESSGTPVGELWRSYLAVGPAN